MTGRPGDEVVRVSGFDVRPLTEATWPEFAELVERHNGVWGGCWCMGYHAEGVGRHTTPEQNRAAKQQRVWEGRAHAALVYDGDACVGWCQFGSADELPRVKNRRAYEAGLTQPPDWRITCFFVDRAYRQRGVAAAALDGAIAEMSRLGGGTVEAHTEDVVDRKVSGSFLFTGTLAMFEQRGFQRTRQLGKHIWLVSRTVASVS